jgi:hypothetical protein
MNNIDIRNVPVDTDGRDGGLESIQSMSMQFFQPHYGPVVDRVST